MTESSARVGLRGKPPRVRPPQIKTFRGKLTLEGSGVAQYIYLEPKRGAEIVELDKTTGERTATYRDPHKGCALNIGDRALLLYCKACGCDPCVCDDAITCAEVTFVDRGGWRLELRLVHGALPPAGDVGIMKVKAPKAPACTLDFSIL